jgi:hypothetical protein
MNEKKPCNPENIKNESSYFGLVIRVHTERPSG